MSDKANGVTLPKGAKAVTLPDGRKAIRIGAEEHAEDCKCLRCLWDRGVRPRSVCVAIIMPKIPCGVSGDTMTTVEQGRDLFAKLGVRMAVAMVQGMSYEHALAEVAARALQLTDCEDVFFLDTDVAFDAQWFAIMSIIEDTIVCGTYEQSTAPGSWCINTTEEGIQESNLRLDPLTGACLARINDTGFGAVRIRRQTLLDMQERYPELRYRSMNHDLPDDAVALWDPIIFEHGGVRRRTAGDTCFFNRARDCGFTPWAVTQMGINHARMGEKSLESWLASKQAEIANLATLRKASGGEGEGCALCGEWPAPMFVEGDGTPGGDMHLCARCHAQGPTARAVVP